MQVLTQPFRRLLERSQRRFVRSRPGSVLILVIALLVLMALIGTAYMTMAQFDRVAAAQNGFNTEVDLLLDGVINQVKSTVTGDLYVNGLYRPVAPVQYNTPGGWSNYTAVGIDIASATANASGASPQYIANPGNSWLASRVPDKISFLSVTGGGGFAPAWDFLTAPLSGSGLFDTPYWNPAFQMRHYVRPNNTVAQPLEPNGITFPTNGPTYPALSNVPVLGTVLAADTDGDGIADAGLYKLCTLDGITYYAGVRIIDNNSAINANIATAPNTLASVAGQVSTPSTAGIPGDFSPVNLDLLDMLAGTTGEMTSLLNYRTSNKALGTAVDDTGTARNDFAWMGYPMPGVGTFYPDQLWAQLGRRVQNPGNIVSGSTTLSTNLFKALPISESMTMARNFILRDPNVPSAASSSSMLEQLLPQTTFNLAPSSPYAPGNVGTYNIPGTWSYDNFNYSTTETNGNVPMRALLVARNPVSNFCPAMYNDRGTYGGSSYNFGDMVTYNGHRYVCINPAGAGVAPLSPTTDTYFSDPNWAFEPWSSAATKISANTGTFQQLYAAFWAAMCTQPNVAPFPSAAQPNSQRMFRSPVRLELSSNPSPVLTPIQVLYLRAAIAAVNTLDLRDSDDDVTSRTIAIPMAAGGTGTQYYATVYGTEKQPYITQVYGQNNAEPTKDWAAIELYNPYPTSLTLNNWQVAAATRTAGSITLKFIAAIPPGTVIPANSYILLEDSNPPPTNITLANKPSTVIQITNLAAAGFGNEVLIMRPRLLGGSALISGTAANNTFTETAQKPNTLVPVDSYDFTNLPPTATTPVQWQYQRPSGSGKNWHFVYPGPWNATGGATPPTGTQPPTLSATKASVPSTGAPTPLNFGVGQTSFLNSTYVDVPIQLNNTDFGGPNKLTNGSPNKNVFPYGRFARNGDMLQIPFIGAYKIWTGAGISATEDSQQIVELNAVTMDSIMATARDQSDGNLIGQPIATLASPAENIGRFSPIDSTYSAGVADDFGSNRALWRYQWATRLFDFLTVLSPQDDYSPNVDPWLADQNYSSDPNFPYTYHYPGTPIPTPTPNVVKTVPNTGLPTGFNASNATEDTAPIDGLVNINTAPWRVLATVPWLPANTATYAANNVAIAQAIVKYRDVNDGSGSTPLHGHGPFHSIFELNQVPYNSGKLRDVLGSAISSDYSLAQGNLSPLQGGSDGVIGDFESQFNMITRVSNLITTRSDSFTAYVLVQGWRNAETATPTLVVQRRAAVIIDRSLVTPSNTTPVVYNIPMD